MNTVPQSFQPFLASSAVSELDADRDKRYIIENLLKNASLEAWQWMKTEYADEEIVSVIKQSRILSPKDVMLWVNYFEIPTSEVRCLQTKSPNTPSSSWVY